MFVLSTSDLPGSSAELLAAGSIILAGRDIRLCSVPSNLGQGKILYFVCPECSRRCKKLYDFQCRYCSGVQGEKPPANRLKRVAWLLERARSRDDYNEALRLLQLEKRKVQAN